MFNLSQRLSIHPVSFRIFIHRRCSILVLVATFPLFFVSCACTNLEEIREIPRIDLRGVVVDEPTISYGAIMECWPLPEPPETMTFRIRYNTSENGTVHSDTIEAEAKKHRMPGRIYKNEVVTLTGARSPKRGIFIVSRIVKHNGAILDFEN